ncbi:hypothetical protein ACLKA7_009098 [Drosophila subpalustris]
MRYCSLLAVALSVSVAVPRQWQRPRPLFRRILSFCIASTIVQQLGNNVGDSYHWELARSVIRIVIAPIIIGLCKPALSVVISLPVAVAEPRDRTMAELRLHSMQCALCWKYTMLATLAMLTNFATWAQMVARFVRLPPRQLIPKWMFSPAL